MIEHFYSRAEYFQSLRHGPLGPYIDGFADLLVDRGYPKYSGKHRLRLVGDLSQWLGRRRSPVHDLNEECVDDFLKARWRKYRRRRSEKPTLALFLRHLRQTGVIPQLLPPTDSPLDLIERDYARFLSCERGVAQVTIDYYVAIARRFLSERFGATTIMIEKLGAQDAGKFILRNTSTQCIGRLNLIASVLRSFLGFLYQRGKTAKNLAAAVPAVANRQARGHQEVLDPDQTKALLNVCNQATPVGRRDYAILLLLSRLGLRACEIVRLKLDDINWESGELLIRGKGAREDRLPLLQDVGQALVNYLQKGRPTCSSRQVFIRAIAPRQAFFTSSAVAGIVKQALTGAHLHLKHQGAHILRHSLATNMLNHGASLTEIGQILRHQKASTTQVYAKVDLASLRALALPWPGGVR